MLLIPCPWCGPRDESEFQYGGEAHKKRPADPAAADDRAWGQYLYHGHNPKGLYLERWRHAAGCRRWFNVARDTVSHEIVEVYAAGDLPRDAAARAVHAANWRRAEEDG
ncbi:MAG: sarcosine oxidase subunit delta [Nisaea sp.]|nr:sarcosine oxidase subunit delta [Nisaea sp.]MEC7676234.1 sarcosine oxidase subunit delta [Pseudomonadota bacterium]MEC8007374.1 sarcosine oxidase subunit delta [Pseudomonadota bacterium]MEC8084818.1 sarcosine oxidase subunit delta [Pseudomonadota bacterium]MEC8183063.1 sarcosine oxidase subunit delta [Pseudomonadota bacterium]